MKQNNDREAKSPVLQEEKHFVIFCKIVFHKNFSQKIKMMINDLYNGFENSEYSHGKEE